MKSITKKKQVNLRELNLFLETKINVNGKKLNVKQSNMKELNIKTPKKYQRASLAVFLASKFN
jgi:autonomous glycyl radical cofactor GrcA